MAEPRFRFYRGDSITALMEIVARVQGEIKKPPVNCERAPGIARAEQEAERFSAEPKR